MFEPIAVDEFRARTDISEKYLDVPWRNVESIVSLRDIVQIVHITVMRNDYLRQLLNSVWLEGDPGERPYRNAEFAYKAAYPESLLVGQTFVERRKYQSLLEEFPALFTEHCVPPGITNSTPYVILGRIRTGSFAIAHYVPPIIEEGRRGEAIMDGVHRNYVVRMVGAVLPSIVVRGVKTPFPSELMPWATIRVVDQKPPREERFYNLRPELFRSLKAIGIDG